MPADAYQQPYNQQQMPPNPYQQKFVSDDTPCAKEEKPPNMYQHELVSDDTPCAKEEKPPNIYQHEFASDDRPRFKRETPPDMYQHELVSDDTPCAKEEKPPNKLLELRLKTSAVLKTVPDKDTHVTSEEEAYYEECKQYYRVTRMPLVSISDGILSNNLQLTSAALKFAIDEDYNEFNIQEFLNKVCNILNINISDIDIRKIQEGCIVLELEFWKNIGAAIKRIKIQALYHSLTDKLLEEMGKLKVFFMFMGDIVSFANTQRFRKQIKLHLQWNRIYGIGHTYWNGALQDGQDRGPHPYYCPAGWKRYALHVSENYDEKFKGWCFCYHGTKFAYGLSILLSGLKPATATAHGQGIYASLSIVYVCHPRYSEVKKIESSEQNNFFRRGKYVQFVLQCRVHPSNIKRIRQETLGAGNTIIDPNVKNNIIEWVVDTKGKDIADFNDPDATIVCTGLMLRVTDNHPGLLPDSQWWHTSHLCNNKNCCALGIDHTVLKNQKINGDRCNIVHE
ncbi:unnamed protein product [Didymodactylos carnosus]|uniref:Uncharacterized protein n=1 Tax=Didymodactylos carnosus TaxID=1234261 RepID=A0A8S2D4J7_9BILA|nr:unnamed protein product [Didymodactylos carnosus]CAF3583340.1 unnamed protein product [Didymodactylos carnosus]